MLVCMSHPCMRSIDAAFFVSEFLRLVVLRAGVEPMAMDDSILMWCGYRYGSTEPAGLEQQNTPHIHYYDTVFYPSAFSPPWGKSRASFRSSDARFTSVASARFESRRKRPLENFMRLVTRLIV